MRKSAFGKNENQCYIHYCHFFFLFENTFWKKSSLNFQQIYMRINNKKFTHCPKHPNSV